MAQRPHARCVSQRLRFFRASRRSRPYSRPRLTGLEPLEARLACAATNVDSQWNGRFESATPYGDPAIPQEFLPQSTWSTISLGEGFFTLTAPDATADEVQAWAASTAGVLEIEPDLAIGPPLNDPPIWEDGSDPVDTDPTVIPNDPGLANQWAIPKIQANSAWSITTGSRQVIVTVIDSGIDLTHPDLAANVWTNPGEIPGNGVDDDKNGFADDVHGWNFIDGTANVQDVYGHGTHVSGIIGAIGNNDRGIAGLNWQTTIMPLKILNDRGVGTVSAAIAAINYTTMMRRDFEANVIVSNNSWGATSGFSQVLSEAIRLMGNAETLFVAAAGNNATNNDVAPRYPSSYDLANVISVAATDSSNSLASFSNYGATTVDLGAPGSLIYSTFPGGNYGYLSGTSMAAPQVTGAVALLAAAKPGLTSAEARAAILGSVQQLPSLAGRTVSGGLLDLDGAMRSLGLIPQPPQPPQPPPAPLLATLPFRDDFNYVDSGYLSGYWTNRLGAIGTTNQEAVSLVAGTSILSVNGIGVADSITEAFFNIRSGTSVGLVARLSGPGDKRMYAAMIARNGSGNGFTGRIWRNTGTTWKALASGPLPTSSGVLRFEVIDTALTLFFNGVRVAAVFDAAIPWPGAVGLRMIGAGCSADNYSAVAPTPPVPTTVTLPFSDTFEGPDTTYVSGSWTKQLGNITQTANAVVSRVVGPSVMTLTNMATADSSGQAFVNLTNGSSAGLVARYGGPGDANMYLGALARVGGGYAGRIWRNSRGVWTLVATAPAIGGSGTLRFDVVGSSLTLSLNGRQLAAAYDSTLSGAGAMGLRFVGAGATADFYSAVGLVPPLVVDATVPFTDDFNRPDSNYVSGAWTKTVGNLVLAGGRVVSRIDGVSILRLNGLALADSRSQLRADVAAGTTVGLVARYTGSGDGRMYSASLTGTGGGFVARLWRNSGGRWTLLAAHAAPTGRGLLTFDVVGPRLTLSLDGMSLVTARDTAIPEPGAAGIRLIGPGAAADDYLLTTP